MIDNQYQTQILCRKLFEISCKMEKSKNKEDFLLTSLLISIYNTIESIFILLENERYWDILVLERSVFEGMLKLINLNTGTLDEQSLKINEFFYLLPEFENIKRYNRAKVVNINKKNGIKQIVDIEHGLKSIVDETNNKYTKKERKNIEHKWSVSELCKRITELEIEHFDMLIYFYNISSNFIHKDATSLGIQNEKTFNYDETYFEGLSATILLNMIHSLSISVIYFARHYSKDINTDITNLIKEYTFLFDKLKSSYNKWFEKEYGNNQ